MIYRIIGFIKKHYHRHIHGRKSGVLDIEPATRFGGHYDEWRDKRVDWMLKVYGNELGGKTVLEVGCGYGQIGHAFMTRGASVTFSDARREHLDVIRSNFAGNCQTVLCDLDESFPAGRFDIVLHLGVLYHLRNPEEALRRACQATDTLFLETEVIDSDDPYSKEELFERGYDQAFGEVGSRPSAAYVERVLTECGFLFHRLDTPDCNSPPHVYDWTPRNDKRNEIGLRRFWYCRRSEPASAGNLAQGKV